MLTSSNNRLATVRAMVAASVRRPWGLLAAWASGACAPFSLPGIEPVARELGIPSHSDSCRFSPSELTRLELGTSAATHDSYRSDWACDMLSDNLLRDSADPTCLPSPGAVFGHAYRGTNRLRGSLFYVDFVALPYAYDIGADAWGHAIVTIRLSFEGAATKMEGRLRHMQDTLDQAAAIWSRAGAAFHAQFRFVIVDHRERPHFSLELSDGCPRAPFDASWGADCPAHVLAHEAGHMLGLDDEYNQIRKTTGHLLGVDKSWDRDRRLKVSWFQCGPDSLMCDSRGEDAVPQLFHYYLMLRRNFCRSEHVMEVPRF